MRESIREKADLVKKEVSIQSYFNKVIVPYMSYYYDGENVDFELKPVCKCPLHSEDTGSFRYYDYSNTFYCFGCGEGGDVIKLHISFMKINMSTNVDFANAVDFLYNTFIAGKEKARGTKRTGTGRGENTEPLSTNIELIKYNRSLCSLESKIFSARGVSQIIKTDAYDKIDIIDKLVSMNLLSAVDAQNMLEHIADSMKPVKMAYK